MANIAEESRPTAIEKNRLKFGNLLQTNKLYQEVAKRINDPDNKVEIGSPEYDKIKETLDKLEQEMANKYPDLNLDLGAKTQPQYAKDAKGNVIVSYDNWKTNEPVKRPITGGR